MAFNHGYNNGILLILISLFTLMGVLSLLLYSNALDEPYFNTSSSEKAYKCNFCDGSLTSGRNNIFDNLSLKPNNLILKNFDITSVDTNSNRNLLYILGIEHKKHDSKTLDRNVILVVDTKARKIVDKIMINNNNSELNKIVVDEMNNKVYGTGNKVTKNNDKFINTDFIYQISFAGGKNKILFKNINTDFFPIESDDNDENGITDIVISNKSNNMYIILNNNSMNDVRDIISGPRHQLGLVSKKDSLPQIYMIPYGNKIVNTPEEKANYVLINGIKSYDKDAILVLNESLTRIIKNYTLPSLNSRNIAVDSHKGKIYVLGDYFAYNNDIKGLSKQSDMITRIDTVSNTLKFFLFGDCVLKDFIYDPKNEALYAIAENPTLNRQQKTNDNYLLQINSKTGIIDNVSSIPLDLNNIVLNDKSQTLFILGRDPNHDQNQILFIDANKKL